MHSLHDGFRGMLYALFVWLKVINAKFLNASWDLAIFILDRISFGGVKGLEEIYLD
jgi:hypothetical protein